MGPKKPPQKAEHPILKVVIRNAFRSQNGCPKQHDRPPIPSVFVGGCAEQAIENVFGKKHYCYTLNI